MLKQRSSRRADAGLEAPSYSPRPAPPWSSRKEASMFREQRVRSTLLRTLTVLLLLLTSVGATGASAGQATTPSTAGASSVTATPSCSLLIRFHRNDFSNPTKINNKWFPLAPGTKFVPVRVTATTAP